MDSTCLFFRRRKSMNDEEIYYNSFKDKNVIELWQNDLNCSNVCIGHINHKWKEKVLREGHTPTKRWDDQGFARRQLIISRVDKLVTDRDIQLPGPFEFGPWDSYAKPDVRYDIGYKTGSGNIFSLTVDGYLFEKEQIPTMTVYEMMAACGTCMGSNGGCPGFAPLFHRMRKDASKFFVYVVHINMLWSLQYSTPGDSALRSRILRQLSWPDRLTDAYVNRVKKHMTSKGAGLGLSVGNCAGCNPKTCTVLQGKVCKTPKKRSFSMEATGIDMDILHSALYGEILPWYFQGTRGIPTYMSRYAGFFVNDGIDYYKLLKDAIYNDRFYIPIEEAINIPITKPYPKEIMEIPSGVHKGKSIYVYRDM